MLLNTKKIAILCICTLLLTACGFHLRQQEPLPPALQTLYVNSSSPYDELTIELKQILKSIDVRVVDTPEEAPVTLKLFGIHYVSEVLSESASSNTKQYTLHFSVQYELTDSEGNVLYGPHTISSQRNYTVNEDQVLSTDTQQDTLKSEMQHDAVFTILRQISSPDAEKAVSSIKKP